MVKFAQGKDQCIMEIGQKCRDGLSGRFVGLPRLPPR